LADYDYIIVGAGSAGCVIANRLTADPSVSVLLLEAGGWDGQFLMKMPLGAHLSRYPQLNWGFRSEIEPGLGDRPLMLPRGKGMGGSSAVNAMAYSRGHPKDYDLWRQAGCEGWGYADVLPYFRRSEKSWQGETPYHGGSGEMAVEQTPLHDKLYAEIVASAQANGYEETPDHHGAQPEGFGVMQFTVDRGRRASTSQAFIHPIRQRTNLSIETGALTRRILIEDGRAVGVEYEQDGRIKAARASREVVLSAGAYGSPQILMLSGIGPADHLREIGVEPVLDLPGVGANLSEHASYFIHYKLKRKISYLRYLRWDKVALNLAQWWLLRSGPFAHQATSVHAQVRTRPELERPDMQIFFNPASMLAAPWFPLVKPEPVHEFNAIMILLHPESRGWVKLRSADPKDAPRIFLNILSERRDVETLIAGLRIARKVFETPPMADEIDHEMAPGTDVQSDAELEAYLRRAAMVSHHPVGTCAMGHGATAVVDPQLRLRGIAGLRVADASIMPTVPGGNTNAPTIMVGEKAADLIRGKSLPPAEL
jgi:choline dehydrogenase